MLFEIEKQSLKQVRSEWTPKELELEKYLITSPEGDDSKAKIFHQSVFGEPLLLINNQARTSANKRADILALDQAGNGVVIELKKDSGRLGVETQALQYLTDFSNYQGDHFIEKYAKNARDNIRSFLGANVSIDKINNHSRIILVARSFDPTIYSMGEWLSSKGVAFRCITYSPVKFDNKEFISFSVAFDRSPVSIFPLMFSSNIREPAIYWHNIAKSDQKWWDFLLKSEQIPACFENSPGDQGERILTKYIPGDKIVAYAKGHGAVGWGTVNKPETYRIIDINSDDDQLGGNCRHRLNIKWQATAKNLNDGLTAKQILDDFNIYHPVSTSVSIDIEAGEKLIKKLTDKFTNNLKS